MEYFWDHLQTFGNRIALTDGRKDITYEQITDVAYQITKDIPERSLLFLVCKNQMASIIGYIACLWKRIVPVLLSHTIDHDLLIKLQNIYQPQFMWCPETFSDADSIYQFDGYKLLAFEQNPPQMNEQLAVLISTSGSTGTPKMVRLSYTNLQSNTNSIAQSLKIAPEDKAITTLPMNYVYGLSIIQTHFLVGARVIVTEAHLLSPTFWKLANEEGATTFGGVPYQYQMLNQLHVLEKDLPSLRYLTEAGGSLGKELHTKIGGTLSQRGKDFIAMYGASEATARMSYLPAQMTLKKPGSIGIAIPGGRFELIDENGSLVEENDKVGELVYYGPNVMMGYAQNRTDLNKDDELQGRLMTGDLAKRDDMGYYYIVGRKNRFVKVFGNRVNLMDIENLLRDEGYDVACIGEDNRIDIFTTNKEETPIKNFISKKTRLNEMAFYVTIISNIPRNEAGKILYSKLESYRIE